MTNKKEICSITIDYKTKELLDKYARMHAISRSATIRLITNDFFIKKERRAVNVS